MSSQKAFINLMTMYHWDETLFDRLQVPQSLDKDALIVSLLLETSDFPLLISDWDTLEFSMYMWSKHRVDIWQHFIDTTAYTYNPIENYDRHETETISEEHTGTGSIKGDGASKTLTYDLAESRTGTVESSTNDDLETGGSDTTAGTGTNDTVLGGADSIAKVSNNDTVLGGSDRITNSGSDRVQTDDDVTRARTGNDTTTEGVSAFNDNGYDDHTRTITSYNSGDSENRDIDTTTSFGKVETTTYGKTEEIDFDSTETTDYGKTESVESVSSETVTYGRTETKNGTYSEESANGSTKTGTETENDLSGKIETRNFADDVTTERYIHGNIGVTTTQEMIKQEREIADYDIIDIITNEFKKEFCILVYT